MRYELFIALRYLRSKRKGLFTTVTTFIGIAGVTIGVAALIVILSVMNGFQADIRKKIVGAQAHVTVYGHMRGFARGIRPGVEVLQGQVIGYVGSTGRATGPHLHYTVLQHGRAINPMKMNNPAVEPLEDRLLPWLAESLRRYQPVLEAIHAEPRTDVAATRTGDDGSTILSGS